MSETVAPIPNFPPGVLFNAPPEEIVPSIMGSIAKAVATLPPDADAALVGVANRRGGNAAFVARVPGGFEVQLWIGKKWDTSDVDYGAEVQKVFRWGKS